MDGLETLRELKAIRPDVQALLCSGYSEQDASTRLDEGEIAGFLQKPFQIDSLAASLRTVLCSQPTDT